MSRDPIDFLRDIERVVSESRTTRRASTETRYSATRCDSTAFSTNFHIIGEAVKKLPDEMRDRHTDIPWREIAGRRDLIAHAYFALDLEILWQGIRADIPVLLKRVQEMIASAETNQTS